MGVFDFPWGGSGGGIRRVKELPSPKAGTVVYVEADYFSGERTVSQTTFTVTPASLGGDSRGGVLAPAVANVTNIFQDSNRIVYVQMASLLVPVVVETRPDGLGVSIVVDDEAPIGLQYPCLLYTSPSPRDS